MLMSDGCDGIDALADVSLIDVEESISSDRSYNWKTPKARDSFTGVFPKGWTTLRYKAIIEQITDSESAREGWVMPVFDDGRSFDEDMIRDYAQQHGCVANTTTGCDIPARMLHPYMPADSYIVVGKDHETVEILDDERASLNTIGKILDIPECCRSVASLTSVPQDSPIELAARTLKKTELGEIEENGGILIDFSPNEGLNVLWNYFGVGFIPYQPCTLNCNSALDHARSMYERMHSIDQDKTESLLSFLRSPTELDIYSGLTLLKNEHLTATISDYRVADKVVISLFGGTQEVIWGTSNI